MRFYKVTLSRFVLRNDILDYCFIGHAFFDDFICKHCRRRIIKYEARLVDFAVPKSTVRFGRNRVLSVTVTSIQQSYLDGSISSNCRVCRADVWPVVSSGAAVAASSVSSFRLVVGVRAGERGCGPGVRGFDVGVRGCEVLVNSTRARRLIGVRSVEEARLTPPFSFWS